MEFGNEQRCSNWLKVYVEGTVNHINSEHLAEIGLPFMDYMERKYHLAIDTYQSSSLS